MIGRAELAGLIPHDGTMCLLDRVVTWDAHTILCEATSQRHEANPLAAGGRLASICGVEYASQAMALHSALTRTGGQGPRLSPSLGYLASLRDVTWHEARLDGTALLTVTAELLFAQENQVIYRFALTAAEQILLSGRAAVMLDMAPR